MSLVASKPSLLVTHPLSGTSVLIGEFNVKICLLTNIIYSDGAAAIVLMSVSKARDLGLQPLAVIRGMADAAQVCHINFLQYPYRGL